MIVYLKKALPINSTHRGSPVVQQVKNLKLIAMVRHFAWSHIFRPAASRPEIVGALTAALGANYGYGPKPIISETETLRSETFYFP